MKKMTLGVCLVALMLCVGLRAADELPKMPPPTKEHEWLKQLAGEWDLSFEMYMDPAKPMSGKGTETTKMLGGFWAQSEMKCTMMEQPMSGNMTLGYSPEKKKYIGTWVDSMGSQLWTYQGTVDESGKILTLDTEGPCPMQGGKICAFKEVIEIKDKDNRTFSSSVQMDGKWVKMMQVTYKRRNNTKG
jgi:hypothetical protein